MSADSDTENATTQNEKNCCSNGRDNTFSPILPTSIELNGEVYEEFHALVRVKARKIGIFLFAALTSAATIFEAEARCSCSRFQFGALMT